MMTKKEPRRYFEEFKIQNWDDLVEAFILNNCESFKKFCEREWDAHCELYQE